jgi:two-component system response regulator AtoC
MALVRQANQSLANRVQPNPCCPRWIRRLHLTVAKRTPSISPNDGSLPPEDVLFGKSAAMLRIQQRMEKVAATSVAILIEGESGTGKELLARWVHGQSAMKSGPFVKVNCAAIPGTLLESELFGYEKGAFTGAQQLKLGRLEQANGGTLFLDAITEIDQELQAKLLQFLQDGRFCRIGGSEEMRVETRIIWASSRNVELEIEKGRFREDLFYRINVIRILVPSLRERTDDICLIASHLLKEFNLRFERSAAPFRSALLQELQGHDWPGNIRELENRVARYVLLGEEDIRDGNMHRRANSFVGIKGKSDEPIQLKQLAKQVCSDLGREIILRTLKANRWNRRRTAEELKISYRALLYKIREAGLSTREVRVASKRQDATGRQDVIA